MTSNTQQIQQKESKPFTSVQDAARSRLFTQTSHGSAAMRLIDYFLPESRQQWNIDDFRQARIMIMTALLALMSTVIVTAFQLKSSGTIELVNLFSLVGILLFLSVPFVLKYTGRLHMTAVMLVFVSAGQFWLIAYYSAGVFTSILNPLFLVSMIGFLLGPAWLGWFAVSVASISVISLCTLHLMGLSFAHIHGPTQAIVTSLTLISGFAFCGIVVHYFQRDRMRVRDIALQALRDLSEAQREAVEANEQKSSFLANMSHELRTPLNAIIGYSELLEEEFEENGDDAYDGDIKKIHSSAKHLLGLINDLLDMSKIEAGKIELAIETFDIKQLIEDLAATVQPLAQKKDNILKTRLDTEAKLMLTADPLRVRQILLNILSNACKFTERGTITLTVESREKEFAFKVQDTGIGMSKEQTDKLFQPFTQASAQIAKKYGGTGLGLFVSQELCHLMGGRIALESTQGQGTTFTITLPHVVTQAA